MLDLFAKLIMLGCATWLICACIPSHAAGRSTSLRTEDTEIRFAEAEGMPLIAELRLSRQPDSHNWAPGVPETALPAAVEIDSRTQTVNWKYVGTSPGKNSVSFTYRCDGPDLELVSTWLARSGPGPVEHAVVLRNRGEKTIQFTPPPTVALSLAAEAGHQLEHWWVEKGAGYVPMEGGTYANPVAAGYSKALHSGPYSADDENRDAVPWFCLHDPVGKHGFYGGIEFSGWTEMVVERAAGNTVSISMGSQPRGGTTKTRVNPGAFFKFPTCFAGVYKGEVDDGCNRLHRWVEKHVRPPMPAGVTPILVNNSWGSGMAVDEELARRMIDDCAELGIELFHVDAGWFKDVGIWHTNPEKFPNGLEKIADYAHSKGLKFGLWVGWTQGGSHKDTGMEALSVFNPRQKNWFGQDYPADWQNWDFTGMPVCLGDADARAWCLRELRRMIKEYKLDLLEHDQVMIVDACTRDGHGHIPGDPVDVSRAGANGYYEIYDRLRKENPSLLFEDCVNGGRLVDFGVAKRAHYICATDVYDQWTVRRAFYDASYPLPPSMIELYVENTHADTLASFKAMLRSAMLGWCTIMMDTTQWTAEQHDAAKREFVLYKQRLRPLIASADLYHVLPRPNGKRWEAFQYNDPKTGTGALYVFRAAAEQDTQTIKLRGLKPAGRYSVEAIDGSVPGDTRTGKELMEDGLTVRLGEKETSDLIFLSAARQH